jgi:L-alanine-DL-glutamate epimerase-like enolase superfamily enzyme
MRIIKATSWVEELKLTRPYTIAYEHIDSVDNVFVCLQAEDGSVGVGVAAPDAEVTGESLSDCSQSLKSHLPSLTDGADIRQLPRVLRKLEDVMPGQPAARAAIDIALHDLWAKYLGLPLVDVLGRCHDSLPTSITIGIKSVIESIEEANEYRGRGFSILKVKIGQSVEQDVERLSKIRQHMGSDIVLRVDANQGYSLTEYMKFIELAESLDLEFVEQPLQAPDFDSMRRLPESVRRITAADESLLDGRNAVDCLQAPRPFGIFNIKLMKCGGIAQGMQIANLAGLAGIDLMWGCMDESRVGIAAALHAALASPFTRYLDLDGSFDLARDLVEGGFVIKGGELSVTDQPGLGVELISDFGVGIAD